MSVRAHGMQSEAGRRGSDRQRILAAYAAVRKAPAAILAFAEGTRFSPAKREHTRSPFRHLLPPRPGGFTAIYDSRVDTGAAIVDLTLDYDGEATFWRFLAGEASVSATATVWDWAELANSDRAAWLVCVTAVSFTVRLHSLPRRTLAGSCWAEPAGSALADQGPALGP